MSSVVTSQPRRIKNRLRLQLERWTFNKEILSDIATRGIMGVLGN